jgi:hypothetical protein
VNLRNEQVVKEKFREGLEEKENSLSSYAIAITDVD